MLAGTAWIFFAFSCRLATGIDAISIRNHSKLLHGK
jgi:hypothetical protein